MWTPGRSLHTSGLHQWLVSVKLFLCPHALHRSPFSASSSVTPTNFMSSFTPPMNLPFALAPAHPPASQFQLQSISTISPLHVSKPSQSSFSGLIFKTSTLRRPSDVPIRDPVRPARCQRETQHFNICYLQLSLLSFPQCRRLWAAQHRCSRHPLPHLSFHSRCCFY